MTYVFVHAHVLAFVHVCAAYVWYVHVYVHVALQHIRYIYIHTF